jgi:signal peptidase II
MSATARSFRSWFWTLAVTALVLDLGTKYAAFSLMEPGEPGKVDVIPRVFSLFRQTHLNQGALFGFGNTPETGKIANILFAVVSGAAVVAIGSWSFRASVTHDRLLSMALGLILGGAAGNCFDRIALGGVRDFLWAYYERGPGDYPFNWPVFNLADAWLVIGAGLLLLQAFCVKPQKRDAPQTQTASNAAAPPQVTSSGV